MDSPILAVKLYAPPLRPGVVGKSFDAVNRSMLTPERYVRAGLALTSYLRDRFDEEKVYVVGESWGSALGIMMVQREPQSFHATIYPINSLFLRPFHPKRAYYARPHCSAWTKRAIVIGIPLVYLRFG